MKLKRFLALAVSLAMVLSIVPAFSLTASAAVGDTVTVDGITYTVTGANLVPNGGFDDGNGNFSWGTWFSPNGSNGNFANNCQDWFYKVNRDTNAAVLYTQSLTADDYALGTRWNDGSTGLCSLANNIAVEAGKTYHVGFDYKHKSGADTGYIVTSFVTTATASTDGTTIMTPARATTSWQTASTVFEAPSDGYVFFHFRWLGDDKNTGNGPFWYFDNFVVEEVAPPQDSTEGTIRAALNELTLPLATKTDLALATTVTDSIGTTVDVAWTSSNTDVVANDGTVTNPADITTVTLTPSTTFDGATVAGDAISVDVFPASVAGTEYHGENGVYTIGTENIIAAAGTAASFEDASGNQSLAGWKAHTGQDTNGAMNWGDASVEVVPDGNWAYIGWWNDNITGTNYCTLDTMWAVEAGKYYLSFYAQRPAGGSTTYVYFSTDDAHHTADSQITSEAWYSLVSPGSEWAKYEYIIDATTDGYIGFTSYNIGNNGNRGTWFDDFELYTAEQAAETLVSVPEVAATAKVIAGNTPVLPTTVAGTGSLGSDIPVAVVWDTTGLDFTTAGTVTVPGTVTDTEFTTSATVTVLPETFTLADSNSINDQPGNVVYFPVEIADEFHMEFDYTVNQIKDVSLQLGYNGTIFSAGALGISPNGNVLKVTGGNKAGTGEGITLVNTVAAGDTFHMFLTADASDDTYTLTVTTADGTVVTTGEKGFRTAHDTINTITLLTNGGGADGDIAVSNIKVSSATWEAQKVSYTVVTTVNGVEESTETVVALSADLVTAEEREGYQLTKTVDGTTITFDYASTKDVVVTFKTAEGAVVYTVTETVQLDESVTVEAKEIYDAVTCAYYAIPATTTATSTEVTVAVVANKYAVVADAFHNSSDAQPWNNTEDMLFVGSAGDTNLADTDANGDRVTNQADNSGNLGSARIPVLKFNVPEVADGQAVKLNLYVAKANQNLGNGNNMKISANVASIEANETTNAYVAGDIVNTENLVWSDTVITAKSEPVDGRMEVNEWVEIDVTNFVKAATGDTITFALYAPTAGAYVADREKAVVGGAYDAKAAYLSLEDAVVVTATGAATLTKNGTAMTTAYVTDGDTVRLNAADAVVIGTDAGYYLANTALTFAENADLGETTALGLGLAMVEGAQVRIGSTELEEGAKLDALADSGIRFLATADYADTVLSDDAVEFGIKVTAEASDAVAYVKAETFQNEDNNVFSAAITNMKESNYNRKYTATAYAKVPMADGSTLELTAGEVTRSIYQVSAGIMKNGNAGEDAPYTVDGVVKNILNAYVNQTGIRIEQNGSEWVADDVYTGDVFFAVESVDNGDGTVTVTITPDTTWGTPVEIATWWADYVRANNSNTGFNAAITASDLTDGVLTITFTVPAAE